LDEIIILIAFFREYLDNIKLVDDGIERIEEAIEEFFDYDGKTVYVFTSDHGMTDWGKFLMPLFL